MPPIPSFANRTDSTFLKARKAGTRNPLLRHIETYENSCLVLQQSVLQVLERGQKQEDLEHEIHDLQASGRLSRVSWVDVWGDGDVLVVMVNATNWGMVQDHHVRLSGKTIPNHGKVSWLASIGMEYQLFYIIIEWECETMKWSLWPWKTHKNFQSYTGSRTKPKVSELLE